MTQIGSNGSRQHGQVGGSRPKSFGHQLLESSCCFAAGTLDPWTLPAPLQRDAETLPLVHFHTNTQLIAACYSTATHDLVCLRKQFCHFKSGASAKTILCIFFTQPPQLLELASHILCKTLAHTLQNTCTVQCNYSSCKSCNCSLY